MGTAIVIILLIVIVTVSVKSYMKKLSSGCCGAGGDVVKRIKPQGDTGDYPCLKRVKISGMTCRNCAVRVENAFNGREGYYAKVDLSKKTADVYMKNPADNSIIEDIVRRAGYEAVAVEEIIRK